MPDQSTCIGILQCEVFSHTYLWCVMLHHSNCMFAETWYTQIEKKLLAVVFACSKFKDCIWNGDGCGDWAPSSFHNFEEAKLHSPCPPLEDATLSTGLGCHAGVNKKRVSTCTWLSRSPDTSASWTLAISYSSEVMSVKYISTARLEELWTHTTQCSICTL